MHLFVLHITFLCGLFLFSTDFYAQNNTKNTWEENLKWSDFKGTPDHSLPYYATTNSGISSSFDFKVKNGKQELFYWITATFNPQTSWVKPGKENESLLKHEQLHFDITELHARKLRKYISKNDFNPDKLQKQIDRKAKKIKKRTKRMQDRYDRNTQHGTKVKPQEKWEKKIKKKLERLKDYKNPEGKIKVKN